MWDKILDSNGDIIFIFLGRIIFTVITVGLIVTSFISIILGFNIFWNLLVAGKYAYGNVVSVSEWSPGYVQLIIANTLGVIGFSGAFLFIFFGYGFNEKEEDKDK